MAMTSNNGQKTGLQKSLDAPHEGQEAGVN